MDLKANTQVIVTIGPFVAVGDGFTPVTTVVLTGGGAADEAELIKHNTTAGVDISARTWAVLSPVVDGYYNLTLTTADTEVEGNLVVVIQDDSLCLPVRAEFRVLAEAAYDSLYAAKDTGFMDVNVKAVSEDTTAADNLELQYDGTGLLGDAFPLRQDQGASISGGLAIRTAMASVTVIQGSQQDLGNASTSNDTRWTGDDDGAGAEFIFRCTPADTDARPGDLHFEGYYNEPTGSTNGATLEVYNFQSAAWESVATFTNASSDEDHDIALHHGNRAPGGGTLETVAFTIGDVLIKFKQDTTETGNAVLLIDLMQVGFIGSTLTATAVVDEWETQSQANPTGFHVNVQEWIGTAVTLSGGLPDINVGTIDANAITATSINADAITNAKIADDAIAAENLATGAFTADAFAADAIVAATLATGALTADAFAADALVAATFATGALTADAFAANALIAATFAVNSLDTKGDWNTVVPDAAGVAPTAVENRQEMDSNSTELAKIGTIPALDTAAQTIGAAIGKLADTSAGASFVAATDSLEAIRNNQAGGGDATQAKQDTIIAAIGTPSDFGSGTSTVAANLEDMADDGTAVYDRSTDSLQALRDNQPVSTGSGANSVTITVNDGIIPTVLENAKVRMTKGAETYLGETNASGVIAFSLDNGTWTVQITLPLYTFTSTTIVVDGVETQTYSMTAESIPASNPGQVTGFLHTYDENGAVEASVVISLRTMSSPGEGLALDAAIRTATSDANGLATFVNLFVGTTYEIRRGTDRPWKSVAIPSTASGTIKLDNILGVDS